MKKIFILMLMLFSASFVFAQSLDDIGEMMNKKDFTGAKNAIDKYLSDPKNASKADGWYFKGRIYNSLSYEKSTPENTLYDLKVAAYDAFKKYQQIETAEMNRMKLENYASYLDLYFSFYDLGANLFNNKSYDAAYSAFKKALEVEDYILAKKYVYTQATLHPLDTALILNTAIAATQAKKDDESVQYYRKLTDANIAGTGYREVYEYLLDYYYKKSDIGAAKEILAKAKKAYPADNDIWLQIEIDNIAKSGDQAALFAKYEEIIANDPSNFTQAYNYAVEIYNTLYGKDAKPDDARKERLTAVLKGAIANDKGIDATVLMANHLYNVAADYSTAASVIKGTKPDDVKKKNELKALSNKKMDECIVYSENAVKYFDGKTDLKPMQVANYKIVLGYLADIYNLKGDKKKADEYEKKKASIK